MQCGTPSGRHLFEPCSCGAPCPYVLCIWCGLVLPDEVSE